MLPQLRQIDDTPVAPDVVFVDDRAVRANHGLKHRLRGEHHRRRFVDPRLDLSAGGPGLLRGALAGSNLFSWDNVARRSLWTDGLRFPEGRTFDDMATTPRLLLRASSAARLDRPCVATRLAVAHPCARNLVAAVRHAKRLAPAEADALIPRCRADFFASVGEDLPLLWRHCTLNGRWTRAWPLWRALGALPARG